MKKTIFYLASIALLFLFNAIQAQVHYVNTTTNDTNSSAIGYGTVASGEKSFASGINSTAQGICSSTLGQYNEALGHYSVTIGCNLKAINMRSMVIGSGYSDYSKLENNKLNSLMIGFLSKYPTLFVGTSPSFDKTGRIGIGNITEPEAKLHIKSDVGEPATLFLQPGVWNGNNNASIWIGNKHVGISAEFNRGLYFHTNASYFFNNGNVGIGVIGYSPHYMLEVNGTTSTQHFRLYDDHNPPEEGSILTVDGDGMVLFTDPDILGVGWKKSSNSNDIYFNIGNVGIGTESMSGYKLTVAGKILTEELTVKDLNDWHDYVLEDGYELQSLSQLELFIRSCGHLPDIPSEKEVKTSGIELGKMQGLLLKKIEELTLYTIEQQKMIEKQSQLLEKQQKQIELLLKSK